LRRIIFLLLIAVCGLVFSFPSYAENTISNYIEEIRYGQTSNGVRVVFDLSRKTDFRAFVLDNPYRVVVDIPNAGWKFSKSGGVPNNSVIKSYRSGDLENGLTRVVFDVRGPSLINKIFALDKGGDRKDRLVLDIDSVSRNMFEARRKDVFGSKDLKSSSSSPVVAQSSTPASAISSKLVPAKAEVPQAVNQVKETPKKAETKTLVISESSKAVSSTPSMPKKRPEPKHDKYVVVIDPGHGGADPGAVANGVMEKNITLALARALRDKMHATGRYNVVMTRDRDYYIKLQDRKEIARKVNADLFISLHADSIDRNNVRGASIYTLSEKASDGETARLAESENNSGFVAGVDLGHESQEVADILLDLAMREKMNESNMFAKILESSLHVNKVNLLPNSTRSAGFAVLKAPDVPSILLEMGFISNSQEAKLLNTSEFREKVSNSILKGVDNYFRKIEELQKF